MAPTLPPLGDVIRRYGLKARRKLGQNFLLDLNLTGRIVRAAGDLEGVNVIEVGPGPGGLTRALLDTGATKVTAIEKDERCIAALDELAEAYPGRFEIIQGDALEINVEALTPPPRQIVANLPYNIATPLLLRWLQRINNIDRLTLMFQKEVGDRLTAVPGSKAYGRLSVVTQWLCEARHDFNVSNTAFTPPPKVASSLTPVMVMVIVWLVPSELVTAKVSVMVAEAARACTALFESVSVYVHAPPLAIV